MKEYRGQSGGRFTYVEDLIYMQDLANAITAVFNEFGDIIIDGISPSTDGTLSAGYIYLNGKIRFFPGKKIGTYPCYIYEKNTKETVMYENEQSKIGRINFSCDVSTEQPVDIIDDVTGKNAAYIKIEKDHAKNKTLKNSFFGKYSVLSNPSSNKQIINGDVLFSGKLMGGDGVFSDSVNIGDGMVDTALNIVSYADYVAIDYTSENIRRRCMSIHKKGGIDFFDGDKKVSIFEGKMTIPEALIGDIHVSKSGVSKQVGRNGGVLKINNNTGDNTTDIEIYDGKSKQPIITISGAPSSGIVVTKPMLVEKIMSVKDSGHEDGIDGFHTSVEFLDKVGTSTMSVYSENKVAGIKTFKRNIHLSSKDGKGHIDMVGELRSNGTPLGEMYANLESYNTLSKKVVLKQDGKALSSNDYTNDDKKKLDDISTSKIADGGEGYVTATDAKDSLSDKISKKGNLQDLEISEDADKKLAQQRKICGHIGAPHKNDVQPKIQDTGWLKMQHPRYGGMSKLLVRQIGSMVTIQGELNTRDAIYKVHARLPNQISAPKTSVSYIYAAVDGSQKNRGIELGIYGGGRELVEIRAQSSDNLQIILTITYMV